jgi:hypothetical protein
MYGTRRIFIPWLVEHGPNIPLLFAELFSTKVGARKINMLWLPIAATCLIGVSCGLPLFLYQRERHMGGQ